MSENTKPDIKCKIARKFKKRRNFVTDNLQNTDDLWWEMMKTEEQKMTLDDK